MSKQLTPKCQTLRELLTNPEWLQPPQAVVPRFLYRDNVTLLAGREKDGKSTLATALAAHVSAGSPFLGEPSVPGRVLWLRLEEPPGTLIRRLVAFGANPDNVIIPDRLPNGVRDLDHLVPLVKPAVVVVDTLLALARDCLDDPYNSLRWTQVLAPIVDLTQTYRTATLLLHHARKSDGKYRDSTAIGANVDIILEMMPDVSDARVRGFEPKGRFEISPFRIRYDGQHYDLADANVELEQKIVEFVRQNPDCGARELRKGVGGNGDRVDRMLTRLVDRGVVRNTSQAKTKHAYRLVERVRGDGHGDGEDTLTLLNPEAA